VGAAALVLAAVLLAGPGLSVLARGVGTLRGRPMVVQGIRYRGRWVAVAAAGLIAWGLAMLACAVALAWVAAGRPFSG
jgi:hypothetical protein